MMPQWISDLISVWPLLGAIATALDEIATLTQSGQNAMKSWTDRARIWVDANTALAELAAGGR